MNILDYTFSVSWNFAVLSLLSETIKNVGGHCCEFYCRRKAVRTTEMNYWSEGDLYDIVDIYMCARVVNLEQVSLDRIKRIAQLLGRRLRELRLILLTK